MPRRPRYVLASLAAFSLLVVGCGDDPTTTTPEDVTLTVSLTGDGAGTVTSTPAGISCSSEGGTCSADFGEGSVVSLAATPDAGDAFAGWSGGCSGAAACSVTLGSGASVTAEFDDPSITTAEVGSAGATLVAPDGAMALVIPAGALAESVEITIEMGSPDDVDPDLLDPSDIRAVYDMQPDGLEFDEPVQARLTIPAPPAPERLLVEMPMPIVVGEDGGIDALGSLALEEGGGPGEVVLVGELGHFSYLLVTEYFRGPDYFPVFSMFAGVSGSPSLDAIMHPVPDSKLVDEEFTVFTFASIGRVGELEGAFATVRSVSTAPLAITPTGSVDLPRDDSRAMGMNRAFYFAPFEVTCLESGQATIGFEFTVDLPGDGPFSVTTFTESAPFTCVAVEHLLTVELIGDGNGHVTSEPAGIDCPDGECSTMFEQGTTVTLTAVAEEGSNFCGWLDENDDAHFSAELAVTMEAEASVSACFIPSSGDSYSLDLSSVENSDGVVAPGTQMVGLIDESGVPVGELSVEFGGDVQVDPDRGVIRFGSGGRMNVDLTNSTLPAGAPAPDEMTVILEAVDNSESSDVGWVRRDADGGALDGNSVVIQSGTLEIAGAPMVFFDLVSGGPFNFVFYLEF